MTNSLFSKIAVCMVLGTALCWWLCPPARAAEPAAGPAIWTATPWLAIRPDIKPPADPSLQLKLVAARGGIASGLVLARGIPEPIVGKGGEAKGTAGAVPLRLRFATRRQDLGPDVGYDFGSGECLDTLSETPLAGEPLQAVWVTADVPATAQAGLYQGQITVADKTIPVELNVTAFRVPPAGERRLYVSLPQSPDSVALRYGVKPWSDRHFELLEPSLQLAGRGGCNIMFVPVIGRTFLRSRNGMVMFTRNGPDLAPDFTALDRYLDLWIKHCGKPRFLVVYLWDVYLGATRRDNMAGQADPETIDLTVRSADGSLETLKAPTHERQPGRLGCFPCGPV